MHSTFSILKNGLRRRTQHSLLIVTNFISSLRFLAEGLGEYVGSSIKEQKYTMEASPSANAHAGQCTDSASLPSFGSIIRVVFSLFERLVAMPQLIAATMLAIVAAIAVKLAPASEISVPTAGWYLLSHMPAPHLQQRAALFLWL